MTGNKHRLAAIASHGHRKLFTKRLRQRHIGGTRSLAEAAGVRGAGARPPSAPGSAGTWRCRLEGAACLLAEPRDCAHSTHGGGAGGGAAPHACSGSSHTALEFPGSWLRSREDAWPSPFPVPWLWSPQPRDSRPFKSSSRPCRDACQGEEGQAALPAPSWSPKPADRRGDGKVRGVLSGFSIKQQKAQRGGTGHTETG